MLANKLSKSLLTKKFLTNQLGCASTMVYPKYETIEMFKEGNTTRINFNQIKNLNAMNDRFFNEYNDALLIANEDKDTSLTVISHNGKYFSSGLDFSMFKGLSRKEIEKFSYSLTNSMLCTLERYIYHKKPTLCIVKGPGIGSGLTFLGIHDYVICSDKAYFQAPFTKIGVSPIDFSSYTFPKIMGITKANELLLFGRKITALEGKKYNLINEVVSDKEIDSISEARIKEFSSLDNENLKIVKGVLKTHDKDKLILTGKNEMNIFRNRLCSDVFYNSLQEMLKKLEKK
ncbi:Enoyl-CoA delta isomerase 2, mitochondrial [Strongyloides ratti]|uniref:Enoyl-CoA delta isomerase 2, mitochondrial n=1 Tax=Strongyloides ratti TaxID=34506 RepID=A0A090MUU1_STRRB|nr:Enoyl-CoA delta isomerase 2, mitochondrial [Strongyloides ratti]CEF62438.1 Enoyl-CoA delta isomerase 2, mitochondrial [Strongyloides ratti]